MNNLTKQKLHRSLGFLINAIAHSMRIALEDELKPFNMSTTQWLVIQGVSGCNGAIQSEVGKITRLDNATITREIDKLENAGLLQRTRNQNDRRVQIVRLTEKGNQLLPEITKAAEKINIRALAGMDGAEISGFIANLHLIVENLHKK